MKKYYSLVDLFFLLCYSLSDYYLFEKISIWVFLLLCISGVFFFVFLILSILEGSKKWIPFILVVILGITTCEVLKSELLKSRIILQANIDDDLSRVVLKLRENNTFEMISSSMFASKVFEGKYLLIGNMVVFQDPHFDTDFIPDTLLIIDNKIVFKFDDKGRPLTTFANYFVIQKDEIEYK
jgi:hypothetical protein